MRTMTTLLLLLASATSAFAGDGVLEINQTCAVQTGCFTGDSAGFPVTIDTAAVRSFRLTGDLIVPNENTTAVLVVANDVSIDLGGFAIRGPNVCSGKPTTCSLTGSGFGIQITGGRARISNGSITGMGSVGVYGPSTGSENGNGHAIQDLRVSNSRYQGIRLDGGASEVRGCTALSNGDSGIEVNGDVSRVVENRAFNNGGIGISTSSLGAGSSLISGNTSGSNGGFGISAFGGAVVTGNVVISNDNVGIVSGNGSTVGANAVRFNNGVGIALGFSSVFRDNSILQNAGTTSGGINAGGNSCNGTATCP